MTRAIGIDLGTTYTVVATVDGGRPSIIPNAEGQRLTPSVVCFAAEGDPLVGEPGRRLACSWPERTVFSIKRRMGSAFKIQVGGIQYSPQQVSGFILRKVKSDAEHCLGETIDRAVVTVPAYFNDRQRQATREAAALAGLEVMRIINEPTAAALAYGLHREDAHTILVWDLGGGTFDVSILELGEGIFEVRAVSGDSRLGGDDWDSRLAQRLAGDYGLACGDAFPADGASQQLLRELAEEAKRDLSVVQETSVLLSLRGDKGAGPLELKVTREQLEALTGDLLQRMVAPTRQALADAGLTPEEIDRVILVGGATRMPAVRNLARTLLGKEPYRYIQPDEVVAMGAAIQAGMLMGTIKQAVLLDVLPLSLGLETQGGLMARLISRNTPLPALGSRIFTTAADYQTSIELHVLQGEREIASENVSLGRFQLDGMPAALRGVPKVEVAFQVDADGIVQVSAQELLSGSEMKVKLASTKFLDTQEIDCLAGEAERQAAVDRERREEIEARLEAQNVATAAEAALKERADRTPEHQVALVSRAITDLREALERGSAAGLRARSRSVRNLLIALASTRGAASP